MPVHEPRQVIAAEPGGQVACFAGVLGGAQGGAEPWCGVRAHSEAAEVSEFPQLVPDLIGLDPGDPLRRRQPDRVACLLGHTEQCGLDGERGQAPGRVRLVQRRDMVGKTPLAFDQPAAQRGVVGGGRLLGDIKAGAEVGGDPLPVPRPLVDVQDKLAQVDALQPRQHSVDGRSFLGDEQHLPAACDQRRGQVGDGLAFACSWRPVNHQAVTGQHRRDRAALR